MTLIAVTFIPITIVSGVPVTIVAELPAIVTAIVVGAALPKTLKTHPQSKVRYLRPQTN
jgi:hypothetical protein